MITLYDIDATTEICVLDEVLECLVTEEQNSIFELEMTYSIYSLNFSNLKNNRVLKAKASDELGEQLFRIYYISNEVNGKIYIKAQHITYDLIDNFIEGLTCTKSTCEQSFQAMLNKCQFEHKFNGYSDIEHTSTYNINRCNALEAILGMKGSLLDTYGNGAKLKRDNYNIYLNKARGNNNGVTIEYSRNIIGYKREIDDTGLITCIYPFAKVQRELGEEDNVTTIEETIILPERFINSKYINNYPHPKILAVDYSEKEVKDIESLRIQANKYFSETKKDIPNINYKVEFIYLHQTLEYEELNLKALETVGMGDVVTVIDERIGMNVEASVIKTVFNPLLNRYESIELGNFKTGINDIIGDLETSVDNALGQINNMYTNFEVLDDKVVSEVSKLEGDIKTSTSLWQQEADNITSTVTDLSGKYTQLKQTVDGFDITGMVTFKDLAGTGTIINGNNITTGTVSGDRISGGTIQGSLLQTYADDNTKGVRISKESMQLNNASLFYETNGGFNIQCKEQMAIGSMNDIYIMPGLNSSGTSTGNGSVVIPNATLRPQNLYVVNNASVGGNLACNGSVSGSSLSTSGNITASNGNISGGNLYAQGSQIQLSYGYGTVGGFGYLSHYYLTLNGHKLAKPASGSGMYAFCVTNSSGQTGYINAHLSTNTYSSDVVKVVNEEGYLKQSELYEVCETPNGKILVPKIMESSIKADNIEDVLRNNMCAIDEDGVIHNNINNIVYSLWNMNMELKKEIKDLKSRIG